MDTTTLTVGAVFAVGLALSLPLGWILRIKLADSRYTHIDGMRAIASVMVVCSHYLIHARLLTKEPVASPLQEAFGAVGVQIFFCITGFLFTRKALAGPVDIPALISSRVRRIVPLYTVCMAAGIALATYIATSVPTAPPVTYQDIMRAFMYGFTGGSVPSIAGMPISGQIGQVWTLHWEWMFYLFVPFIAAALTRRGWFPALLAFSVLCAAYQFDGTTVPPWTFFVPGMLCALVPESVKLPADQRVALFVVGVAAFVASLWIEAPAYGLTRLTLCVVGFPCLLFGHQAVLSLKPLRVLGEVSYSVYLVHLVIASGTSAYIQTNWDIYKTLDDKLPVAAAALVGMFVLSFVTYALFERPFMRAKHAKGNQSGTTASAPSSGSMDLAQ